jgi:hypothetical protein
MDNIWGTLSDAYQRLTGLFNHFDGLASILLRLILAPVLSRTPSRRLPRCPHKPSIIPRPDPI